ncbi:MAG: hypothetical protein SF123_23220 [Chloroflexota bacterium]|nr:hypothetical protein [Chloroflexota bacterium]
MVRYVVWLIMGLLLVTGSVFAQNDAIDPQLQEQMNGLEAWTEEQRGLPLEAPITRQFPTREEVQAYITDVYETQLTPELARQSLVFYAAVGMLPVETDLVEMFINVMGSQVAGFYDPETREMNVIPLGDDETGSRLALLEQVIYVHEYTHALQDEAFDLDNFVGTDELMAHPDRAVAALSLVEGDATLVMTTYLQAYINENPLAAISVLTQSLTAAPLPEGIPDSLLRELMFPYEAGMTFVSALYLEGGWDAVDAAFANAPTTTEQILHPDKYFADEGAESVEVTPVGEILGNEWELMWDTSLGEFYLTEHLRSRLETDVARTAAAGWGGDAFQVYATADNEIAWLLIPVWDTEADWEEFLDAYRAFAADFAGGDASSAYGDNIECYESAAGALCMESDALYIAYAPTMEQAAAMVEAQMG